MQINSQHIIVELQSVKRRCRKNFFLNQSEWKHVNYIKLLFVYVLTVIYICTQSYDIIKAKKGNGEGNCECDLGFSLYY